MELRKTISENESIIRIVSTAALGMIAIRSFIKGNRLRGLVAAGGAVAIGATASTLDPTELDVMSETEEGVTASTIDEGSLQCSVCSDPIVPGQSRRPNTDDEIAHEACL